MKIPLSTTFSRRATGRLVVLIDIALVLLFTLVFMGIRVDAERITVGVELAVAGVTVGVCWLLYHGSLLAQTALGLSAALLAYQLSPFLMLIPRSSLWPLLFPLLVLVAGLCYVALSLFALPQVQEFLQVRSGWRTPTEVRWARELGMAGPTRWARIHETPGERDGMDDDSVAPASDTGADHE